MAKSKWSDRTRRAVQSYRTRSFRKEFHALCDSGCRLYYPGKREIRPDALARTIAGDPDATYMRDNVYDREGKVIGVYFMRIQLSKHSK